MGPQGGSVLAWAPGMEALPPDSCPAQALPGAEVGGDGEDAGQGGDDAAHVGEEGQVMLVHGIHLHRGHLGP